MSLSLNNKSNKESAVYSKIHTFITQTKKNQKGAILLVILAISSVVIPLVQGVWLDSQIEYKFTRYRMNELQARYNAKAGMSLSLLRVYIAKGVEQSVSGQLESITRPLLDKIWSFPFIWPIPTTDDLLANQRQDIQNSANQSFLKGTYITSILPEDGRLNINDLSSPLIALNDLTRRALFNLLLNLSQDNTELEDEYETYDLEEILNNLSDWTDLDNNSQNGGQEDRLEPGKIPPNRSFISVDEIKKVPGVTLDIFKMLTPYITVYGGKSLNINYASMEILQALNIPETIIDQILIRTQSESLEYSPFLTDTDFCEFMNDWGSSFCDGLREDYKTLEMLSFSHPTAFLIKSTGKYRGSEIHLEALLYDISAPGLKYQKIRHYQMQKEREPESESELKEATQTSTSQSDKTSSQKKRLLTTHIKNL